MEALGELFKFACIMGAALTQSLPGFSVVKNRSATSTVWLVLSDCPSVCGWYAVDMSSLVPNFLNKVVQNSEMNLGSLSEMISSGIPQSAIIKRSRRASAH